MSYFTLLHVVISLLGIASGFVVLGGFLIGSEARDRLRGSNAFFLVTTIATNATGFGFPFVKLLPSHILAALSLAVLAVAVYARYSRTLAGRWNAVYVATSIFALYVNVLVFVVQAFLKVALLQKLAPTQQSPPFAVAQLATLAAFVAIGIVAVKRAAAPAVNPA